mgnify:CR=1 FL=1
MPPTVAGVWNYKIASLADEGIDVKEGDPVASFDPSELMRELGCPRETVTTDQVIQYEPTLGSIKDKIVGGDYTHNDESGDVYKFTSGLANACHEVGVKFMTQTTVTRVFYCGGQTTGVQTTGVQTTGVEVIDHYGNHKNITADAVVVCMGSFSAQLVRPLGIKLDIYPGKGYSATYQVTNPDAAPVVSLTDDEFKLVFSRLGDRLRVAGTCELNGYTRELNMVRCEAITRPVKELFPDACEYDNAKYWTALRPLTPSNVPYVGKTKIPGLFLNTGHGTLGWTMGCGSGRAVADIITKGSSEVELRQHKL